MPPRKEPKEAVVYAASKRKAAPFKPVIPNKIPRTSTTESESSVQRTSATKRPAFRKRKTTLHDDDDEESDKQNGEDDDSDETLADDPLTARPRPATKSMFSKPAAPPQRRPTREPSPMSISDDDLADDGPPLPLPGAGDDAAPPVDSQPNSVPAIPQPLLVRLLHEHFADKTTKIDKNAVQVLQKYLEVFVRETIARAALRKKEDGGVSELDAGWLEGEDLERVAAGMVLDF
jgi:hypothetical protein